MDKIDYFIGKFRVFSNFYPCKVELDGVFYPSVEHAYQAAKTLDLAIRRLIASTTTASEAKRIGKDINSLRLGWDKIKIGIMTQLIRQKFEEPWMRQALLNTGEAELIEGNWWGDTFWGVCRGKGTNWLGKILMEIRAEIRRSIENSTAN